MVGLVFEVNIIEILNINFSSVNEYYIKWYKRCVFRQIGTSRSGVEMKTLILLAVVAFVLSTALHVYPRSNDYYVEDTGLQLKKIGNDLTVEDIGRWFINNSKVTSEKSITRSWQKERNSQGWFFLIKLFDLLLFSFAVVLEKFGRNWLGFHHSDLWNPLNLPQFCLIPRFFFNILCFRVA